MLMADLEEGRFWASDLAYSQDLLSHRGLFMQLRLHTIMLRRRPPYIDIIHRMFRRQSLQHHTEDILAGDIRELTQPLSLRRSRVDAGSGD